MLLFILLTYENLVTKFENYRELYFDEKFFLICKFNLPYRKGKSQSSRITRAFDDLNDTRYDYNSNHESKYSVTFFQSIQGLIIKSLIKKYLDLSRFIQNELLFFSSMIFFFFQQQEKKFSVKSLLALSMNGSRVSILQIVRTGGWLVLWIVAETLLCCTCIKFMKTGMNPFLKSYFPGKQRLNLLNSPRFVPHFIKLM